MQDIKRRIRSVTSIEHITNAMKLVSASKLRRAKNVFEKTQEYLHYVTDSIDEIFNNVDEIPDRYLAGSREIRRTCYVVITSNRGLAGSFNASVIKETEREMADDPEKPLLVCIGSKGRDYFAKREHEIFSEYLSPPENVSFVETGEISKPIVALYNRGEIDEVVLVYTNFISTLEQRVKAVRLLPFEAKNDPEIIRAGREVEYEPSTEAVFNYLVPKYAEIMVYRAIVESATCEHAARRIAMENATDNARDMMGSLQLYYNRARQAAITSEITEIVSGADAING
ncbi:MAG: ATP synthase F1 subunit gamma [Clostridiales Family XIII bacterium]|jgi:F-type H+-transporting ATPase subunit gamma|nr:ATP synthase F1 subunit gamma [Clostridiales Family XIII bacterium]